MIKVDLVERVAEAVGCTKTRAEEIVNTVFDEIVKTLASGEKVNIRKFGCFEVVRSNRTKGRNLKTGEEVSIPPKNVVKFRPSRQLRKVVEE